MPDILLITATILSASFFGISEILPFVKNIHANGILHLFFKNNYHEKNNKNTLILNFPSDNSVYNINISRNFNINSISRSQ